MEDCLLLKGLKVLEAGSSMTYACGRILADLGAYVIKVEKPEGDYERNFGPYYHDIFEPEGSLPWFVYNLNKKGITLNIETADGQEILKSLVRAVDCVVVSFPTSYLQQLGLSYTYLTQIKPDLIMTSITDFGQGGPYMNYQGSDLVDMAMGGLMYITGDPDRPPISISCPQAYSLAGANAAAAMLMAYYYHEISGEGQYIDISAQQSISRTLPNAIPYWELNKRILGRMGSQRLLSGDKAARLIWPCKDGFVSFAIHGGIVGLKTNQRLAQWMKEEGITCDLLERDWAEFDLFKVSQDELERLESLVGGFFKAHTKKELYEGVIERGIMLYPCSNAKDLVENPQLESRKAWAEVDYPKHDTTILCPGTFAQFSETPCAIGQPAPCIGEHNQEIYEQLLGLSREDLHILKQSGVI